MILSNSQIQHVGRYVKQLLIKVPIGVIGGYHGINLGDIALGTSVIRALSSKGIKSGLQTIYNLEKWNWPKSPYAIVGGGAVGYDSPLKQIARRYKNEFNKVALLGVDFNEENYWGESLELMKKAVWISCRSEAQALKLKKITGREDVIFHPDLAFSLLRDFCDKKRQLNEEREKKLLINVVPLYAKIVNGKVVPSEQYTAERPELYDAFSKMHESYKKLLRDVVEDAIDKGYKLETIPFTPMDEAYGKIILNGYPVHHAAYHSNVDKMLATMANADWVFATRYHATIFALKVGAKITPLAYAKKNEMLLEELGISRSSFLTTDDLAKGNCHLLNSIQVESQKISGLEIQSEDAINNSIKALYGSIR